MTVKFKNGLSPAMYSKSGGGFQSTQPIIRLVVGLGGQSNQISRAAVRPGIDDDYTGITGRVFQWGYNSNSLSPATNTLDHVNETANCTGLWLTWAKAVLPQLPSNYQIVLVPCAQGGTTLANWANGGSLHTTACARINSAMGLDNAVFGGMLWLQGESNADAGTSRSAYATALAGVMQGFESKVTGWEETSRIVMGTIKPDKPGAPAINSGMADYVSTNAAARLVDLTDLTWYDADHYDAASIATAGVRYAQVYF